ncbi:hypothetical protein OF83DRAFT_1117348 [Amylostereum chailletii]|nr:hypothetical protein OF83DRAFT_1117348 [Amylostereum chailletii]
MQYVFLILDFLLRRPYRSILSVLLLISFNMRPPSTDIVTINRLPITGVIGTDMWGRAIPQPVHVSLHFHLHPNSLLLAAATDDSRFSIQHWTLMDTIPELVRAGEPFASGRELGKAITNMAVAEGKEVIAELRVVVEGRKTLACMRAQEGVEWELVTRGNEQEITFGVKGLVLAVKLGFSEDERKIRQSVVVDIWFVEEEGVVGNLPYNAIVEQVIQNVEASSHRSLERLVHEAARVACLANPHIREVTILVKRSMGVVEAESLSVQLTRLRSSFPGGA